MKIEELNLLFKDMQIGDIVISLDDHPYCILNIIDCNCSCSCCCKIVKEMKVFFVDGKYYHIFTTKIDFNAFYGKRKVIRIR